MDWTLDVKAIQDRAGITPDRIMGQKTWDSLCMQLLPTQPSFHALSEAQKKDMFGDPTGGRVDPFHDDGTFTPANEFRAELVSVDVPGWFCVRGSVTVHGLAADPLRRLLKAWQKAGLEKRVLSFGGSVAFRKVRGGVTLSSHAFGTAFDINVPQNALGSRPAMPWEQGSVLEMVKVANAEGWYWGGHFTRLDGQHFEVANV